MGGRATVDLLGLLIFQIIVRFWYLEELKYLNLKILLGLLLMTLSLHLYGCYGNIVIVAVGNIDDVRPWIWAGVLTSVLTSGVQLLIPILQINKVIEKRMRKDVISYVNTITYSLVAYNKYIQNTNIRVRLGWSHYFVESLFCFYFLLLRRFVSWLDL